MTSPSEANQLVHYEDFELAQSVKRELMQLRLRSTMPNSKDVMLVARKAALAGSLPGACRAAVDKIRVEAWLAICKLAAAIDRNARLIEGNRPDALVNTSLLWARAIDLGQAWMRAAKEPRRKLVDLTTESHDVETRARIHQTRGPICFCHNRPAGDGIDRMLSCLQIAAASPHRSFELRQFASIWRRSRMRS
jgi:hypothetical protein